MPHINGVEFPDRPPIPPDYWADGSTVDSGEIYTELTLANPEAKPYDWQDEIPEHTYGPPSISDCANLVGSVVVTATTSRSVDLYQYIDYYSMYPDQLNSIRITAALNAFVFSAAFLRSAWLGTKVSFKLLNFGSTKFNEYFDNRAKSQQNHTHEPTV